MLFVTNQLDVGGIETNLRLLARALTLRGHRVAVAARAGVLSDDIRRAGATIVPLEMDITSPRSLFRDVRQLKTAISIFNPDIAHVFSASSALLTRLATFGNGAKFPVVSTIMGIQNSPDEKRLAIYARAFMTTFGARTIIVVSPAIASLLRDLPVRSSRLVPGQIVGVEVPDLEAAHVLRSEARERLGLDQDVRVVMTIGTLKPSKSHELFIVAAEKLLKAGSDARFVIVGDGPLRSRLQDQINGAQVEDRIRLAGEYLDAAKLIWGVDVYVRPGLVEGFVGITVLEAQAREIPVVSFQTEDVELAIEDGKSGILVPNGDVAGLASAINLVLTDSRLARSLGRQGRIAVESTFGLDRVVQDLEQLYLSLTHLDHKR